MDATPTKVRCGHRVRWDRGDWGQMPVICGQTVGVTTWTDETGLSHSACALHIAEEQHRWPVESPLIVAARDGR